MRSPGTRTESLQCWIAVDMLLKGVEYLMPIPVMDMHIASLQNVLLMSGLHGSSISCSSLHKRWSCK